MKRARQSITSGEPQQERGLPDGYVLEARDAWSELIPAYPRSLLKFMGRSVRESRVGFVQQQADDIGPVFVRPAGADKLFSGFVYRSKADDWRWQGAEFRDRVFVCEPVEFETEVRVYVVEHRIVGIATYTPDAGNPEAARDPAEEMLRAMKAESEQTAGFALDLGKIRGGDWVLVECNDGFALGMYPPLSAIDYARLILARWNAIAG